MPSSSDDKHQLLREVLQVVVRRWRLFAIVAMFGAFFVLVGAHRMEKKYTSTAVVKRTEKLEGRGAPGESSRDIRAAMRIELTGRSRVEQAVEALGLTKGLPRTPEGELTAEGNLAKQRLIQRIMSQVNFRWDVRADNIDVVSVSFTDEDPQLAADMANALVQGYVHETSEEIIGGLQDSRAFYEGKVRDAQRELMARRAERVQYQSEHPGQLPKNPSIIRTRIEDLQDSISVMERNIRLSRQKLERINAMLGEGAEPTTQPHQTVMGPNPERQRLEEELRQVESRLDEALAVSGMKEDHPRIKLLRRKIDQLTQTIEETPREAVIQRVYGSDDRGTLLLEKESLETMIAQEEGVLAKKRERLEESVALAKNLGPLLTEFENLKKAEEEAQKRLTVWQNQLQEVERSLNAEVKGEGRAVFRILRPAERQYEPSTPTMSKVLSMALGVGVALGAGVVLLVWWLDRSFKTMEDASSYLSVPIHGVIGEITTPWERLKRKVWRFGVTPVILAVMAGFIGLGVLSFHFYLREPDRFDSRVEMVQWLHDEAGSRVIDRLRGL